MEEPLEKSWKKQSERMWFLLPNIKTYYEATIIKATQ